MQASLWLDLIQYQAVKTEEGADLEGLVREKADHRIVQVYGYQNHINNWRHLYGGIVDNEVW